MAPVPLVHAAVVGFAPLDGKVNVGVATVFDDSVVVRPVACDHAYVSGAPSGFVTVAPSVIEVTGEERGAAAGAGLATAVIVGCGRDDADAHRVGGGVRPAVRVRHGQREGDRVRVHERRARAERRTSA